MVERTVDELKDAQKDLTKAYKAVDNLIIDEMVIDTKVKWNGTDIKVFTAQDQTDLKTTLRKQTDLLQRQIAKIYLK